MRTLCWFCFIASVAGAHGCSKKSSSANVPQLHSVKGVVNKGGLPVNGGTLFIRPDQDQPNLMISANVGPDGRFEVVSMDTQDRDGKKRPGAPEGTYRITYAPPGQDQTVAPIDVAKAFAVETKGNEWTIELNEKK